MEAVMSSLEVLRRIVQKLGPYLMLEILLPGGSLFALLLFLYRRRAGRPLAFAPVEIAVSMSKWGRANRL